MTQEGFTLIELEKITSSTLIGNPDHLIFNVNTLESAAATDASFLANARYQEAMLTSLAGVVCIDLSTSPVPGKNYLVSANPSLAFQKIIEAFLEKKQRALSYQGIHPTAYVHPTVKIGKSVTIGPFSFVDQHSSIGDNTVIMSHVSISSDVEIGSHCYIYPQVTIRENCILKNRIILQSGAVIGSCGFGYLPNERGEFIKLKQLGNVLLEDDVEIGANTTIDRARFKSTVVAKGSKIDNLVQIAHNVEIGRHNAIAAQTGIAGSTKTGNFILMGGQCGIVGHVEISDRVMLATRSGVSKSIKKPGKYGGSPTLPLDDYNRQSVLARKLDKFFSSLSDLKKRLEKLETSLTNK